MSVRINYPEEKKTLIMQIETGGTEQFSRTKSKKHDLAQIHCFIHGISNDIQPSMR